MIKMENQLITFSLIKRRERFKKVLVVNKISIYFIILSCSIL